MPASKKTSGSRTSAQASRKSNTRATVSGPTRNAGSPEAMDGLDKQKAASAVLVQQVAFNRNKSKEYGAPSLNPPEGVTAEPSAAEATASTLSEKAAGSKTGSGKPDLGVNPGNGPLDRVRTDSSGRVLTTNQGVPVADNQSSLKAGIRGPALLEDFILREKITHFDHERIPERIVHARGSAAHGYFECYEPLTKFTRASLFNEAGKRTPVFTRFSTVVGERGSADTVRDIRGFAVKFYTDEGNWDLVGNNIPVFFIQDAMKFPDLIHAAKPEPHFGMPQAATAHDTFWDFVSLMPESTHVLMWAMSDRGIPRSYRMMQGFGVHTFRLVNERGISHFVKFHWEPVAGTHSLTWDEAAKITGADPDFHRRDLWESIEAGAYPEYELGMQIFTEETAASFSFDVLDATKLIPEELVPVRKVGRMVLNRNPDNFFAETEQVAFCTAHIVPGLDFSNDPLLAGRIHSYVDTQISRLGGANFHEIPINSPISQSHNNQRDGQHRQAINRGRVAYEPNSLAGGCPFQAGMKGFTSFREPIEGDKVRGKPELFADHYTQATLFWNSQSPVEQAHIAAAFRFELTKVQVPAIRERMVASLVNVSTDLAAQLAEDLGMDLPKALPKAIKRDVVPEVTQSEKLSLFARPGDGSIVGRHVALLVVDGVEAKPLAAVQASLVKAGAVARLVGGRLGTISSAEGKALEVDVTLETTPGVLYDAVVLPGGSAAKVQFGNLGQAAEFLKEQYRHCKPILTWAEGREVLEGAGIFLKLPSGEADHGIVFSESANDLSAEAFIAAIASHRHFAREVDPPRV
jgi:catalase